jgi:hypothetical protein
MAHIHISTAGAAGAIAASACVLCLAGTYQTGSGQMQRWMSAFFSDDQVFLSHGCTLHAVCLALHVALHAGSSMPNSCVLVLQGPLPLEHAASVRLAPIRLDQVGCSDDEQGAFPF